MHKTTKRINILINPVSAAAEIILYSFHSYKLHLQSLVVSDQLYILTRLKEEVRVREKSYSTSSMHGHKCTFLKCNNNSQ